MTYDDMLADYHRQQKARRDHALASNRELIAAFRSFAFSKGVSLTIDNFDYVMKVGIIAAAPDLTHRLISPLSPDRDGLYSFADLRTRFSSIDFSRAICSSQTLWRWRILAFGACYTRATTLLRASSRRLELRQPQDLSIFGARR